MAVSVFVLRPEPGLAATMKRGLAMGLDMQAMPLSHAEPVAWNVPDGAFDGILLGSANGLRHAGEELSKLTRLPVYAVGEATAQAARDHGFRVADIGTGGLQGVIDSLPADRPLNLLRLAGAEHVALRAPSHLTIHTAITYAVVHRALAPSDVQRLQAGGVVLLHSGAVAYHFACECDRVGIDRRTLAIAALAPRIAGSVSEGWKSTAVAATPDDAALLSLAADMCH